MCGGGVGGNTSSLKQAVEAKGLRVEGGGDGGDRVYRRSTNHKVRA
jgi:hypothetical protein